MKKIGILLGVIGLTACGGSDSGSAIDKVTAKPDDSIALHKAGQTLTIKEVNGKPTFMAGSHTYDDINVLVVDGKTFVVGRTNDNGANFNTYNNRTQTVIASGHLSYAKYGWVSTDTANYLFYQGHMTPSDAVPTKGVATYKGFALYQCNTCSNKDLQSTSQFRVDFDSKALTGTIANSLGKTVELSATLSGNGFSGVKDGTQTTGAFFGKTADEIGGIFVNTSQDFGGVFGAKKQ